MKQQDYLLYRTDSRSMPELTLIPILVGVVLGIIFGASSLYLALKVGMTVSASIPVAVLSITLFKAFSNWFKFRKATILENNIVQTTGSAGESIAFGVAVTMPALLILGYEMELTRIMTVAVLGGLLGVLMMIPLRYALIVKGHGELVYPEGTACAHVLVAGEKGGAQAITVFTGFFAGLIYKLLNVGAKLWNDVPSKALSWFKGAALACEVSPELLGVGYIIGPRIACIMVGGGVLSSFVLIPMIVLFGSGLDAPLFPATKLISEMSIHEIWSNYILYIGAGAVATGGIISMLQSLPTIIRSAKAGFTSLSRNGKQRQGAGRNEEDIPMVYVLAGIFLLILAIWIVPSLKMNLVGSLMIVCFGFLFVTVSSRLTGEIGSSSNPISGMTVATLLITSFVFLLLGWVGPDYRVGALSVAAVVCVAASVGGTTSQDLKTGFLIGATPKYQQIAILIGSLTSAVIIGFTLNLLNEASTVYSTKNLPSGIRVEAVTESLVHKEQLRGAERDRDTASYHVMLLSEPLQADQRFFVDEKGHVAHERDVDATMRSRHTYKPLVVTAPEPNALAQVIPGKYLVKPTGELAYFVDPGINGVLNKRDDGSSVQKYEAPKARLMSLIIDGILTQKLPWGLVLLGVFIAVVLELCGIASLPFAVGVYLPLSSSMPIFCGGMIRWLAGKWLKRGQQKEDEETGRGVLFSSGLIAGGAIGGIFLALIMVRQGVSEGADLGRFIPVLSGSNVTSVVMFALLAGFLFLEAIRKKNNSRK
jgi:putative OPT family oligopeptide transporter